ncbi:hypothetical protein K1T71_009293 [Dendrolimus kikuchii]|uniref:Uncharacterized protein n=1 Tax=Dendrolimus kikuchii TaxID=765133 RepID=A0ACC1CV71_9NEOP|nr:hypothetical protein K1T71_009293 [Dendrolimus kikuchii]
MRGPNPSKACDANKSVAMVIGDIIVCGTAFQLIAAYIFMRRRLAGLCVALSIVKSEKRIAGATAFQYLKLEELKIDSNRVRARTGDVGRREIISLITGEEESHQSCLRSVYNLTLGNAPIITVIYNENTPEQKTSDVLVINIEL